MKVFLEPVGICAGARSFKRIRNALSRYAPNSVEIVNNQRLADLVVLYAVGDDAIPAAAEIVASGRLYAVFQACLRTSGLPSVLDWVPFWTKANIVWSYYDLRDLAKQCNFTFLHGRLGLDDAFLSSPTLADYPRTAVLTTGYVSGPGAEAIQEVWDAALKAGLEVIHVGPRKVVGVRSDYSGEIGIFEGVSDRTMADFYRRCRWVAALRYVEGFELPAAEGLSCGARPILFDQPDLRYWYGNSAVYIPELCGQELTDHLYGVFQSSAIPVGARETLDVRKSFDWKLICETFWAAALSPQRLVLQEGGM